MDKDRIRTRKISSIVEETPTIKTFSVQDQISSRANPGQFVMLWVPGSGEIPLAVSGVEGDFVDLTVKKRGSTTEVLHELTVGDTLGIRGPYGHGFSVPDDPVLLVGGGYGIAPLRYLYQRHGDELDVKVIAGASAAEELLFLDALDPTAVATEDGSRGSKGTVMSPVKSVIERENFNSVFASGPEKMIYRIFDLCKKNDLQLEASLERIMKCGVGICGSCLIDGFRVCQDGPVVDLGVLKELDEFGVWERTLSGRKTSV